MKSFDVPRDFRRYLEAKESIDDRALNVSTMISLGDSLGEFSGETLRVLEVGSGVGNMLPRLLRRGVFDGKFNIDYTGIDIQPELSQRALEGVAGWAASLGLQVVGSDEAECELQMEGRSFTVRYLCASLEEWSNKSENESNYDLVVAQAVLDILDAPLAVNQVFSMLRPAGFYYFPIHFDGNTIFEPVFDAVFDAEIEAQYHESMDKRLVEGKPSGDSRTGRHLFSIIEHAGGEVLCSGGSSWVVHPNQGSYHADEAYFLHFIVDGVYARLCDSTELSQPILWQWAGVRHTQIEEGALIYIAHQLDFFGRGRGHV